MRAGLFAATGIALLAFWAISRPTNEMTAAMQEWPNVLWFSATLILLAVAVATFGRMVGGRAVTRASLLAAAGVTISSIANVFEDGLRIEVAFFGFVLGALLHEVGLLTLGVVIVRSSSGRRRLLALVPVGSCAGFLLFVVAGGPILLVTWLLAAAAALAPARKPREESVAGTFA